MRAILSGLGAALLLAARADAAEAPRYRATLSELHPLEVRFELAIPRKRDPEAELRLSRRSAAPVEAGPRCDKGDLSPSGSRRWAIPRACRLVSWTAALVDQDAAGVDAAEPTGAWSGRGRWWLLTDRLPLFELEGSDAPGLLEVRALLRGRELRIAARRLPRQDQPPFYMALAASGPRLTHGQALTIAQFGNIPDEAGPERMQEILEIWEMWRQHIVPPDIVSPSIIDLLWIDPPPETPPGFQASAGAGGILMQNVPSGDPRKDGTQLDAAILLIGAHEGFHLLIAGLHQSWPEWVNESWASHFAWRAAKERLSGAALAEAEALVNAPSPMTILEARGDRAAGAAPRTDVLYGKGARFWSAIDAVLTTRDGPAGRLGALIQDSRGFLGVDWTSIDSLAAFLDARSDGRAKPIIRCYLTTPGCPDPAHSPDGADR